jgi:hypothetical protein
MLKTSLFVFICLFRFAWCDDLLSISYRIDSLLPYLSGYPPMLKDSMEYVKVKADFYRISNQLEAIKYKKEYEYKINYLKGKLWYLGHNMDIDSAWIRSEKYLLAAIEKEPKNPEAINEIATLYVNTGFETQSSAEKWFRELSKCNELKYKYEANKGLAFSFYYQGKMDSSKVYSEKCLKEKSNDSSIISVNESAVKNLKKDKNKGK